MRITKKFAGSSCIGKQVFTPCDPKTVDHEAATRVTEELKDLEDKFRAKVDGQRVMEYYQPAFAGYHPMHLHASRMPYMENVPPEYFSAMASHPPFQQFMPNPYFMKMYRGQDMAYPFMLPHPNPVASSQSPPTEINDYRQDHIPTKPVSPRTFDSSKLPVSVSANSSPKIAKKDSSLPKTEKVTLEKVETSNGAKIDLDASDLLLNFFKTANEAMGRTRRAESIELETAKFENELLQSRESASSVPSSTVASTSNLVGLVSCSSSDADHDDSPGSPLKLSTTLKRIDHDTREQDESLYSAKRMKVNC